MNFAYFRKSKFSLEKTVKNVSINAKLAGWKLLGEVNFPDNTGKIVLVCKPEWVKKVLEKESNLIGFLPCAISVFQKDTNVLVGTGQPAVIKAITQNKDVAELAEQAEQQLKGLIHTSAGISDLKPERVKLYSTKSCPYCKMEKIWLVENNIEHEVIFVDQNQEEAQKMVQKTGQMGVPVTEIQFEGAEPEYIIGFDKPKLSHLLNIT